MVDDDVTQDQGSPPDLLEPIGAFYRALGALEQHCDQLGTALRNRDPARTEVAAGHAYVAWLAVNAAWRRLESRAGETGDGVPTAALALDAARHALRELFARAQTELAAPALHATLSQLRLGLALANGEPPRHDRSRR